MKLILHSPATNIPRTINIFDSLARTLVDTAIISYGFFQHGSVPGHRT